MKKNATSDFLKRTAAFTGGALFLIVIWHVASTWLVPADNRWLSPGPVAIGAFIAKNSLLFLTGLKITGGNTLFGLILGAFAGLFLAVVFHLLPVFEKAALPFISTLPSVPVIAIAPLITLWIGSQNSVVFISAFICFFPILLTVLTGLSNGYRSQREYFSMQGATWTSKLLYLDFGASLAYFAVGLRSAAPLAVIGALVAEFIAPRGPAEGLGTLILRFANQTNIPGLLASALVCAFLGMCVSGVAMLLSFLLLKKFPPE